MAEVQIALKFPEVKLISELDKIVSVDANKAESVDIEGIISLCNWSDGDNFTVDDYLDISSKQKNHNFFICFNIS